MVYLWDDVLSLAQLYEKLVLLEQIVHVNVMQSIYPWLSMSTEVADE